MNKVGEYVEKRKKKVKQPGLEKLSEAIKEMLDGKGDPLNLVNAFLKTPMDVDVDLPSEYWIHRFCAFAEILQKLIKDK